MSGGINLAALTSWRAEAQFDNGQLMSLFGVSGETLQRIEAGEIEPSDELAERIGRFLDSLPDATPAHGEASTSSPASSKEGVGDFLEAAPRAKLSGAMFRKGIENGLIAQLRMLPVGAKPHTGDIRRAIAAETGSCSGDDLRAAIERLRLQGKLHWSRIELSASMLAQAIQLFGEVRTPAPDHAPGADPTIHAQGGGDLGLPGSVATSQPPDARRGRRSGVTHAGNRPIPAPAHESEVQRAVREEADQAHVRRVAARSGGGKVVPVTLTECVASLLAEEPADLIVAINRRHKAAWGRILLLGRATGKRPGEALYAALEAGLVQLEQSIPEEARHAA